MDKQLYLLCFTQRSGSNYICDLLKNSGLGIPGEYYYPYDFNMRLAPRDFNRDFEPKPQCSISEYFQEVIRSQPGPAAGIKISWRSFLIFRRELGESVIDDNNIKLIYLTRRNKLYQAVSWYKAECTKQWSSFDKVPANVAEFDHKKISEKLYNISLDESRWELYLSNKDALRLVYEELSPQTIYYIAHFLGVKITAHPQTRYSIQRNKETDSWVARYIAECDKYD